MKLTPVLIVEDKIGFAILQRQGAELMLQSIASVRKDVAAFAPDGDGTKGCGIFIEVEDFEDVRQRLEGYPIVLPERLTFYGMREIGVREPSGHTVIFAAKT